MSATLTPPAAEQRMVALARANRIRSEVAQYKRDLAALPYRDSCAKLAEDITDPDAIAGPLGRMGIGVALESVTRLGNRSALPILRRSGIIQATRHVRDISARQRDMVALELHFRARTYAGRP